jgi:hypothetical protein
MRKEGEIFADHFLTVIAAPAVAAPYGVNDSCTFLWETTIFGPQNLKSLDPES